MTNVDFYNAMVFAEIVMFIIIYGTLSACIVVHLIEKWRSRRSAT